MLEDDEKSGRPKTGLSEVNIQKVRDFIKENSKSSVRLIEDELEIPKSTVHNILTESLGLRKLNSRFVPHKLTDNQKMYRIEHCKDLIKTALKDSNFLETIVTGEET
ncbi:protein GVQW3-like [Ooceraea biroi]|uniref:protein GVQW3-like n=1 Tax=Ooceraea biroi TaxID=2015173 RepID=UPI000F073CFF|nr:protein GVQW3-like [Ooceraea biroi]